MPNADESRAIGPAEEASDGSLAAGPNEEGSRGLARKAEEASVAASWSWRSSGGRRGWCRARCRRRKSALGEEACAEGSPGTGRRLGGERWSGREGSRGVEASAVEKRYVEEIDGWASVGLPLSIITRLVAYTPHGGLFGYQSRIKRFHLNNC